MAQIGVGIILPPYLIGFDQAGLIPKLPCLLMLLARGDYKHAILLLVDVTGVECRLLYLATLLNLNALLLNRGCLYLGHLLSGDLLPVL